MERKRGVCITGGLRWRWKDCRIAVSANQEEGLSPMRHGRDPNPLLLVQPFRWDLKRAICITIEYQLPSKTVIFRLVTLSAEDERNGNVNMEEQKELSNDQVE